jgi:hypothetical protein
MKASLLIYTILKLYTRLNLNIRLSIHTTQNILSNGAEDPMVIILTLRSEHDPDRIVIYCSSEERLLRDQDVPYIEKKHSQKIYNNNNIPPWVDGYIGVNLCSTTA